MYNTKIILDYPSIIKRSSCLLSENNEEDRSKHIDRIIESIISDLDRNKKISTLCEQNTRSLMVEMSNVKMASKYYDYVLSIIEYYNEYDQMKANSLLNEFVSSIIPYIENMDTISEAVNTRHEKIYDSQRASINESIKKYIAADRIIENHNALSKRFNIETEMRKLNFKTESKSIPVKYILNNCCTMIDTYNIPCYQKMNVCLEEVFFLAKKNNISINFSDATKYIAEYYLLNNDIITAKEMKGIRKVLSENIILTEENKEEVSFIVKDDITTGSIIKQCIQSFLVSPEKNTELLIKTINLALDCDFIDLSNNLGELLIFITDAYNSGLYDSEELDEALVKWTDDLEVKLSNALESESDINIITKEYASSIFAQIQKAYNYISYNNDMNDDNSVIGSMIKAIYDQLDNINSIVYSESNIRMIEYLSDNDITPIPVNELKIFKRHNLIRALSNLDDFLSDKIQSGISKVKSKLSSAKDKVDSVIWAEKPKKENKIVSTVKNAAKKVVDGANSLIKGIVSKIKESTDDSVLYEFVGEDNKFDVTIYRMELTNEDSSYISEVSETIDSLCNDINTYLEANSYETLRCYYEINPSIVSIHIKDATPLILSESELQLVKESKSKSEDFNYYVDLLAYAETYADMLNNHDIEMELLKSVHESDYEDSYSYEKFQVMMELSSILGIDEDTVNSFAQKYSNYKYNHLVLENNQSLYSIEERNINSELSSYEIYEDATIEDKLEALMIFESLLSDNEDNLLSEANIPSPDNGGKEEKKKGGGLNLNKLKLYLQGLKTKFKGMSQKEKEISKKIDTSFKGLVKGMKDTLISDRREAIIKGSVIPSFSKCIKIGVALAGIAKFGHPEVAAIAAIGGFITSKKLTKRERLLLLDELEIELDVIDKEINNAESRGQMKKYRALMQQKKSLQRQMKRIKYNAVTGRDLMPNSEIGIKKTS